MSHFILTLLSRGRTMFCPYLALRSSSILIWLVRLSIFDARPKAAALNLFHIGPASALILEIYSCSGEKPLTLALAAADFKTFWIYPLARLPMLNRIPSASITLFPRTQSITSLRRLGDILINLALAFTNILGSFLFILIKRT